MSSYPGEGSVLLAGAGFQGFVGSFSGVYSDFSCRCCFSSVRGFVFGGVLVIDTKVLRWRWLWVLVAADFLYSPQFSGPSCPLPSWLEEALDQSFEVHWGRAVVWLTL